MKKDHVGAATLFAFMLLLVAMVVGSFSVSTSSMLLVSLLMFFTCVLSAIHLMGARLALLFISLSITLGFFAEYCGTHYGWFFGEYEFTDALGPRLFGIPVVIPFMWFNLTYISYVMGNLIQFRSPVDDFQDILATFLTTVLSAGLVTAYDLAADPYMVFVTKAWIMKRTDGWWFGETIQGFVGWMVVSFIILLTFKILAKKRLKGPRGSFGKPHALVPILIFMIWMLFQVTQGYPLETRTVSAFAMGIPLIIAFSSWRQFGRCGNVA